MKKQAFVLTLGVALFAVVVSMGLLINASAQWGSGGSGGKPQGGETADGDYRLSGPYTHKNLSIFLVHGKSVIKAKSFLTLQERWCRRRWWSTRQEASTNFPSKIFRMKTFTCSPATS